MSEESFNSRLRLLRQARKKTQAQLAAQSGVTRRTYAYWEAGEHAPGNQELDSLIRALGLTQEEQQKLLVLLPAAKVGRIVRVLPGTASLSPPPGLGDLIRALRWRKQLSREVLARALGVNRTTVRRWEESLVLPGEEARLRLCDALNALPAERTTLLTSSHSAPLWEGDKPSLEQCQEQTVRLEKESMGPVDLLFDLRAHLLAGTLWHLSAREPHARSLLAQTYAAHAAFVCLRGDDNAALDYSARSLHLIRAGAAPPEAAWYRAVWASNHALTHRSPQYGARQSLRQVQEWLPRVQTPDTRATFLLSATSCATQAELLPDARHFWKQTLASTERAPHSSRHFADSMLSVYADLLVEEVRYDEGLEVNSQIKSDLYQRQINRLLFAVAVFLKAGDKNEADSHLRRAYGLISAYQVDHYRKDADDFADQLERLS